MLAGVIPKLGDLGVEGRPASAQVNDGGLQQGLLTLGLYDRSAGVEEEEVSAHRSTGMYEAKLRGVVQ